MFDLWGEDAGHIEHSPAYRLPALRIPAGVPRPLPDDVFAHALGAADERAQLMMLLAANAGLRRSEISRYTAVT